MDDAVKKMIWYLTKLPDWDAPYWVRGQVPSGLILGIIVTNDSSVLEPCRQEIIHNCATGNKNVNV